MNEDYRRKDMVVVNTNKTKLEAAKARKKAMKSILDRIFQLEKRVIELEEKING